MTYIKPLITYRSFKYTIVTPLDLQLHNPRRSPIHEIRYIQQKARSHRMERTVPLFDFDVTRGRQTEAYGVAAWLTSVTVLFRCFGDLATGATRIHPSPGHGMVVLRSGASETHADLILWCWGAVSKAARRGWPTVSSEPLLVLVWRNQLTMLVRA